MLENDSNLSMEVQSEIENIENVCFVSMASLYEIAIKKNIGKLDTIHTIESFANEIEKVGLKLI
jgi:PIN domain nuclease of toxin-antitoxin system